MMLQKKQCSKGTENVHISLILLTLPVVCQTLLVYGNVSFYIYIVASILWLIGYFFILIEVYFWMNYVKMTMCSWKEVVSTDKPTSCYNPTLWVPSAPQIILVTFSLLFWFYGHNTPDWQGSSSDKPTVCYLPPYQRADRQSRWPDSKLTMGKTELNAKWILRLIITNEC